MSEFVNYNKRAITLPPGRKDLIDVLQGKWTAKAKLFAAKLNLAGKGSWSEPIDFSDCNAQQFRIRSESYAAGGLPQVERFVARLAIVPRQIVQLTIKLPGADGFFTICPMDDSRFLLVPNFIRNWRRSRAILEFFAPRNVLPVTDNSLVAGEQADADCVSFYPLPADVKQTSALVVELLRQVYGLTDESGLEFVCLEPETPS